MTGTCRSGKTLIELVLIIALIGMVMTVAGKTMAIVLNKGRSGRDAFLANSDRSRFANDFRRDVNGAESAELSGDQDQADQQLDLSLPEDKMIEYRIQDDKLTRLERQGEQVLRREKYRIGFVAARFEIASGTPERVSLTATISHRPENSSALPRQLRIDAVTAKDLRFQSEGTP